MNKLKAVGLLIIMMTVIIGSSYNNIYARPQRTLNLNTTIIDLNNRNQARARANSQSTSSSGVYNGDTIISYPAIPQRPDHSNEIPQYTPFNFDMYYWSLIK